MNAKSWLLATLFLLSLATQLRADLKSDYHDVEVERAELEDKLQDYRNRLDSLVKKRNQLEHDFRQCINQAWRVLWESRRKQVEDERGKLEEENSRLKYLRTDIEDINIDLERKRIDIETKYKRKGKKYEAEIRKLMVSLRGSYFRRVNEELLYGYDEYMNGISAYITLMETVCTMCREGKYGEFIAEKFTQFLKEIAEAIGAIKGIFSRPG